MTRLLGGTASPTGWVVQFLDTTLDAVVDAVRAIWSGQDVRLRGPRGFPDVLDDLPPYEAPWSRQVVVPCGGWVAYLNNGLHGGDGTAFGPAVARDLGVRCVVAQHAPPYGPGHQGTQLEVTGPGGEPPLMHERILSATATDGRWEWHASGRPFSFEDQDRYGARRVRDRFDREVLVRYLDALGIPVDDDTAYGDGVVVELRDRLRRRTVTLEEARRDWLGLTPPAR